LTYGPVQEGYLEVVSQRLSFQASVITQARCWNPVGMSALVVDGEAAVGQKPGQRALGFQPWRKPSRWPDSTQRLVIRGLVPRGRKPPGSQGSRAALAACSRRSADTASLLN
jgi:hypothetical protein